MSEKFKIIKQIGNENRWQLIVNSKTNIFDLHEYIKTNQVKDLIFNSFHGFNCRELSKYSALKEIENIEIVCDEICADQLIEFSHLKSIYLSSPIIGKIDFSKFGHLQDLNLEWSRNVDCSSLRNSIKTLTIRGFKGDAKDISELNLEKLEIIQGNFTNLDFIRGMKNLRQLSLYGLKNLINVDVLSELVESIEILEIESCKNVDWYELLTRLINLEMLRFTNNGKLENLLFVKKMTKLKFISFVDTYIMSEDISPCLDIAYVGFLNNKKYNYKCEKGKLVKV